MPFNGAGTFTLVTGNPVITGTVISSTVHNNTNNDIASGLTNTVTRDGQSAPMANLPMGGFKHTGAADAVANGQYVTYGQLYSGGSPIFVTKTDLANGAGASVGAAMVGIGASYANAATVGSKLRKLFFLTDALPDGYVVDGSVDYSTQIQAAIDNVATAAAVGVVGGTLYIPRGIWSHGTTQLVMKNGVTLVGDGYLSTRLLYTGSPDQMVVQNPINASTVANIHVEGIYFKAMSLTAQRANFFDTGSSLLTLERCFFESNAIGLILDQSELVTVRECYCAGVVAGAWLVNGTDRNPGASTDFTNRIKFDSCQFNGTGSYIGVIDDGGVAHSYVDNNFNAGTNYLRIAAVQGLVISGGEYELATGSGIHFRSTKWNGAAAFATTTAHICGGYFYNAGSVAQVDVGVAGFGGLTVEDCTFNTAGNPFSGFNNCASLRAENNRQQGAGTGFTGINNYFTGQTFTCTWTGATTNPVLGNGTLVANVSRHGQRVTMTVFLTAGTTTTFGTGNWMFSLPFVESNIGDTFQVQMTCAGGLYIGVGSVGSPANRAGSIFTSTSTSQAVQSTVPAAWAANSSNTLKFTASYLAANIIG